jgi:Rhs element Vgr protein
MPGPSLSGADRRATDLTTFTVRVDGKELPKTYGIVAVDIARELNRIPVALIVLHDGDVAKQDFEISSAPLLVPGQTIDIEGGYAKDEKLLFKGIVIAQRIKVNRRGDSLLHIEARDPAFRLTLERRSQYFTEMTDSDLFEDIIGRYSELTAQSKATTATIAEIVQYQVSDWDFIVSRAEKAGMYCLPDDGALRIEPPDLTKPVALTLAYGSNIFDLDLEIDARSQYPKVIASAWDQANQAVISAEVEDVPSPVQGNLGGVDLAQVGNLESFELRHSGSLKQQEIDAWAKAGMIKSRFAKIRGTIRFQGQEIRPGDLVELQGLGERFNGTAFVSGVRHMLGMGDWETMVQVGHNPQWHHELFPISASPAAGLHPAIAGLQIGVVTQLKDDPEGEDRVLVRLPLINPDDPGIWTRVATLDAGQKRGTFFLPEIGDEVVIGFINDDPQAPVMLGMLHSSNKPAPLAATDENHEKGIFTRSGMKVLFNDDTPSIAIETPKGNKIVIDEKAKSILVSDETGNSVTLDDKGISLESPGKLVVKTSGDISIEGMNISIKAGASLTAEGSASATLKSGGNTVVKGSLVQIN